MKMSSSPAAPLYRDPIFDGASDPTIIWNREEKEWWILYTQRRANVECAGFAWVHGSEIGIAASGDGGKHWTYRGTANGLAFEHGKNTFWAPEVLWENGLYHMYVSYVRGVPQDWSDEAHIVHFTSRNLWDWRFESVLRLSSDSVIDACVCKLPAGNWRMWYREGMHTYAADSGDLYHWDVAGPVITDCAHEGPNVFFFGDCYWMITDPWDGFGVYRSPDCQNWNRQGNLLSKPGIRPGDTNQASHGDVLVLGGHAYLFYHVHPEPYRDGEKQMFYSMPLSSRRSVLQVAELECRGGLLLCDRNKEFSLDLPVQGNAEF